MEYVCGCVLWMAIAESPNGAAVAKVAEINFERVLFEAKPMLYLSSLFLFCFVLARENKSSRYFAGRILIEIDD